MRWCWSRSLWRKIVILVTLVLWPRAFAIPQEPPKNIQQQSLDGSVRDLQDQLRALRATVREIHEELTRSRAEAGELRHDLESTREQLLGLKGQIRMPGAQVSTSSAHGHPTAAQLNSKPDESQREVP